MFIILAMKCVIFNKFFDSFIKGAVASTASLTAHVDGKRAHKFQPKLSKGLRTLCEVSHDLPNSTFRRMRAVSLRDDRRDLVVGDRFLALGRVTHGVALRLHTV